MRGNYVHPPTYSYVLPVQAKEIYPLGQIISPYHEGTGFRLANNLVGVLRVLQAWMVRAKDRLLI